MGMSIVKAGISFRTAYVVLDFNVNSAVGGGCKISLFEDINKEIYFFVKLFLYPTSDDMSVIYRAAFRPNT